MRAEFDVIGEPRPQGSKRAFVVNGKARMTEASGKAGANWRDAVATAAVKARADLGRALDGPLTLSVVFRFKWPESTRRKRDTRAMKPKSTAPDLSKLVRSLEDGLQAAGLITDDARICHLTTWKYDVVDQWTGASVMVYEQ